MLVIVSYRETVSYTHLDVYKRQPQGSQSVPWHCSDSRYKASAPHGKHHRNRLPEGVCAVCGERLQMGSGD